MRAGTSMLVAAMLLGVTGCGPRLAKVVSQGEIIRPESEEVVARAHVEGEVVRGQLQEERNLAAAQALATCAPDVCAAISRGEVMIGMTEAQVLAATRTTAQSWQTRRSGGAMLMTAAHEARLPSDVMGPLAWISFDNEAVSSYTYREAQGFRTVASRADAAPGAVAAARADALLRQGDEYAAAGDLSRALQRYDQADILRPGHAETTLRIATTLDKQLRPIEAILRYQLFIHQLEMEKLYARGEIAARIAEAIARAHERIIVLERR